MGRKKNRKRQEIPADESKADRFVRVVEPRVRKAVKAIGTVAYCSGPAYEHTPEQIGHIIASLGRALDRLGESFATKSDAQDQFSFDK